MTRGSAPRILVVAYTFPPHAAIGTMRTLRLVRELVARRWEVHVLTGDPTGYLPSTPIEADLLARVPPEVRVVRARAVRPWLTLDRALRRGFARPRSTSAAAAGAAAAPSPAAPRPRRGLLDAVARAKDVVDAALAIPDRESGWLMPSVLTGVVDGFRGARPDVIYSSAPPWTGQLAAACLSASLRCPWVADFRDPWARAPWREDRYGFALKAAAALERLVIHRADRVLFVTEANRAEFARKYGEAAGRRFDVVTNGCDLDEFASVAAARRGPDDPFVLLHAGSLYGARTPAPVIDAIALAVRRGLIPVLQFQLRLLGADPAAHGDLLALARERGVEQVVQMTPRVRRAQSLQAMADASALLLLQQGHPVSVPGKVYEYLAAKRPILAVAEQEELVALLTSSGAGLVVREANVEAIAQALATLFVQRHEPFTPASPHLYDGRIRAAEMVRVLEQVMGRPRA